MLDCTALVLESGPVGDLLARKCKYADRVLVWLAAADRSISVCLSLFKSVLVYFRALLACQRELRRGIAALPRRAEHRVCLTIAAYQGTT